MDMFLLHDAKFYHERLCPTLAESARRKSFGPMRDLAAELASAFDAFVKKYYLTSDERPLLELLEAYRWERGLWRFLAGEFLLYASADSLETNMPHEALSQCVPAELCYRLYRGSRTISFQGYPYRHGLTGLHDASDVLRLDGELAAIDTATWSKYDLRECEDVERADELEWIQNRFAELRAMIERARSTNCVIVCEQV